MDDILILVNLNYETDEEGNQIAVPTERTVFCQVNTASRSEFYQAAQAGLHPEYVFTLSDYRDYQGEKMAKYTDWQGIEHDLYITRSYRAPDGNALELTTEERSGDGRT